MCWGVLMGLWYPDQHKLGVKTMLRCPLCWLKRMHFFKKQGAPTYRLHNVGCALGQRKQIEWTWKVHGCLHARHSVCLCEIAAGKVVTSHVNDASRVCAGNQNDRFYDQILKPATHTHARTPSVKDWCICSHAVKLLLKPLLLSDYWTFIL